jgi:hypothetical protein
MTKRTHRHESTCAVILVLPSNDMRRRLGEDLALREGRSQRHEAGLGETATASQVKPAQPPQQPQLQEALIRDRPAPPQIKAPQLWEGDQITQPHVCDTRVTLLSEKPQRVETPERGDLAIIKPGDPDAGGIRRERIDLRDGGHSGESRGRLLAHFSHL